MFRRRTRPRGCFFRDGCIHASHSCGSCGFCSSDRAALLSSAVQLLLFNGLPRRPCSPLFRPSCFLPCPFPFGASVSLTSPLCSLYSPHWLFRWFFLGAQLLVCRHGSPFYLRPLLFPRPPFSSGASVSLTSPLCSLYSPHWLFRWFFLDAQLPVCRPGSPFFEAFAFLPPSHPRPVLLLPCRRPVSSFFCVLSLSPFVINISCAQFN